MKTLKHDTQCVSFCGKLKSAKVIKEAFLFTKNGAGGSIPLKKKDCYVHDKLVME